MNPKRQFLIDDLKGGGLSAGRRRMLVASMLVLLCAAAAVWAQETADMQPAATQLAQSPGSNSAGSPTPDVKYGAWVLVPPLATIVLAILLRQVIPALATGVLLAAYMLVPCLTVEQAYGGGVLGGLRLAVETYFFGALASVDDTTGAVDYDHLKIVVFTLMIGGMVGVVSANGGTRSAVEQVARWASTRERGQLATWFAGLVVFFDDYANAMIVGPSLRPMTDRLKISRAKLAYIVDSTAAPVASIALVGTWIGTEISYIQQGLDGLREADMPAFLQGVTAYGAFLWSIPYRFYAILALVMVFFVAWLGRDFGAMRKAEQRLFDEEASAKDDTKEDTTERADTGRAWYAIVPVGVLVLLTMSLLVVTGWPEDGLDSIPVTETMPRWIELSVGVLTEANAYNSILYGAMSALGLAFLISLGTRALSLTKCVEAALAVMSRMLPTVIVLAMAWTLSSAMGDLRMGQVAVRLLQEGDFDARWLPALIFLSACVVSFATGTSYGTMGILCPATVTITASLLADTPTDQALPLFYAAIGAVLAGAVFGDHCSPISDTTVLSSLASECSLEQHVWTQIPYAVTVAVVSILCGDILCRWYEQPWWVGLLVGSAVLMLIVLLVGQKPRKSPSVSVQTD